MAAVVAAESVVANVRRGHRETAEQRDGALADLADPCMPCTESDTQGRHAEGSRREHAPVPVAAAAQSQSDEARGNNQEGELAMEVLVSKAARCQDWNQGDEDRPEQAVDGANSGRSDGYAIQASSNSHFTDHAECTSGVSS
jgi:hypothetical protein